MDCAVASVDANGPVLTWNRVRSSSPATARARRSAHASADVSVSTWPPGVRVRGARQRATGRSVGDQWFADPQRWVQVLVQRRPDPSPRRHGRKTRIRGAQPRHHPTQTPMTGYATLNNNSPEAEQLAHLGSWERELIEDRVWWSGELYRIFGLAAGSRAGSRQRSSWHRRTPTARSTRGHEQPTAAGHPSTADGSRP